MPDLGIQTLLEVMRRPNDCVETIADARRGKSSIHGTGLFSNLTIEPDGFRVFTTRVIASGEELTLDYFDPLGRCARRDRC